MAACMEGADELLLGSLVTQTRRCGKASCRCATDTPHGPYLYLSTRRNGSGMRYVPSDMLDVVNAYLQRGEEVEAALAAISAINAELLARRHLP